MNNCLANDIEIKQFDNHLANSSYKDTKKKILNRLPHGIEPYGKRLRIMFAKPTSNCLANRLAPQPTNYVKLQNAAGACLR